jgi:hypothetical protein
VHDDLVRVAANPSGGKAMSELVQQDEQEEHRHALHAVLPDESFLAEPQQ